MQQEFVCCRSVLFKAHDNILVCTRKYILNKYIFHLVHPRKILTQLEITWFPHFYLVFFRLFVSRKNNKKTGAQQFMCNTSLLQRVYNTDKVNWLCKVKLVARRWLDLDMLFCHNRMDLAYFCFFSVLHFYRGTDSDQTWMDLTLASRICIQG